MPEASGDKNIWVAASDGDQAAVQALIKNHGFSPRDGDENGYTPVMAAASWGHLDLLKYLLELDRDAVNQGDSDGDQPLHHLADATDLPPEALPAVLQALLEAGAQPGATNDEGKTPVDTAKESDPPNLEFLRALMTLRPDLAIEMPVPEDEMDDEDAAMGEETA